jgi:hypothetical protein
MLFGAFQPPKPKEQDLRQVRTWVLAEHFKGVSIPGCALLTGLYAA